MKQVLHLVLWATCIVTAMDDTQDPLYDMRTFTAVQSIQKTVDEWLTTSLQDKSLLFHMAHHEHDTVHHHLRQTKQGIIIEWALCAQNREKKVPRQLWTPWGQVPLVGAVNGNCQPIVDILHRELVLDDYHGLVAPILPGIYQSVHVCKQVLLPPAELLHQHDQRPLPQVQAAWKTLLKRFSERQ